MTHPAHNACAFKDAAHGTLSAQYEYGPFGEVIRMTGPMAKLNPFRFSTKYQDDETDLLYYGYRYYSPSTGRWLSRDPYNEIGFKASVCAGHPLNRLVQQHLYAFVANSPIHRVDALGLISEGDVRPPPENEVKTPPSGPFKQCRIALKCEMTYVPRTRDIVPTGQNHCGLVIDTGDGVYQLDGSGGTENRRNLTPGSTGNATGPWKDNPSSVCECLFSSIDSWNAKHVPRDNLCANSNWNLKSMNKKCNVQLDWGSESKPMGYNCQECTGVAPANLPYMGGVLSDLQGKAVSGVIWIYG